MNPSNPEDTKTQEKRPNTPEQFPLHPSMANESGSKKPKLDVIGINSTGGQELSTSWLTPPPIAQIRLMSSDEYVKDQIDRISSLDDFRKEVASEFLKHFKTDSDPITDELALEDLVKIEKMPKCKGINSSAHFS